MYPRPSDIFDPRMPTSELQEYLSYLHYVAAHSNPTEEESDALWAEIDQICDELAGRQHDLEDPSSGLGCHQPT